MVSTKIKYFYLNTFIFFSIILGQNMNNTDIATVGGGCFWCIEAVYQRIEGVISVIPGYAGGESKTTTYKEVCSGKTGHAEVAKIEFNKDIITYKQLLNIFWQAHDPTTLNRQGNDVGTQYRSVIYYHNNEQKMIAMKSKSEADKSGYWDDEIITEISEIYNYSDAEDYHNDYYDNNPNQPYCVFVIKPKLDKLLREGIIK